VTTAAGSTSHTDTEPCSSRLSLPSRDCPAQARVTRSAPIAHATLVTESGPSQKAAAGVRLVEGVGERRGVRRELSPGLRTPPANQTWDRWTLLDEAFNRGQSEAVASSAGRDPMAAAAAAPANGSVSLMRGQSSFSGAEVGRVNTGPRVRGGRGLGHADGAICGHTVTCSDEGTTTDEGTATSSGSLPVRSVTADFSTKTAVRPAAIVADFPASSGDKVAAHQKCTFPLEQGARARTEGGVAGRRECARGLKPPWYQQCGREAARSLLAAGAAGLER
jgi:hypothetical protein